MLAPKPVLYALLVGIDAYLYPVQPLSGCVGDVLRFKKFLEETEAGRFTLQIETLINEKASKAQVAARFEAHLGAAGSGDVALFYYSGHGAQERADPRLWRFEPDGRLEGLVCHDSVTPTPGQHQLLCDKELRFLIHRVAHGTTDAPKPIPPHVVAIFDCCHSGDNTRDASPDGEESALQVRRFKPLPPRTELPRLQALLPVRPWEQFLFAPAVRRDDLMTLPLEQVLPEGRHISLSACQSDELAYESGGAGIFTHNLMDILRRSDGQITYSDLGSRLRSFIKSQFPQSPRVYAGGDGDSSLGFLGRPSHTGALYANVVYTAQNGWAMDLGAIHGVSAQAGGVRIVEHGKESPVYLADIRSIAPAETLLSFDSATEALLDRNAGLYRAHADGFRSAPIRIFVEGTGQEPAAEVLRSALQSVDDMLRPTNREREADYAVYLREGRYAITHPGDPGRPLVLPSKDLSAAALAQTVAHLKHISRWEYVKNLEPVGPKHLPPASVAVEFFRVHSDGVLHPIPLVKNELRIEFEAGDFEGRPYGGRLRIRVRNLARFPVYVSLLYLSNGIEVYGALLGGKVQKLPPLLAKGAAWVFDGQDVGLLYEHAVEQFNHPESLSYFKLIASRIEFSIDALELDALPDPTLPAEPMRSAANTASGSSGTDTGTWHTRLFPLRLPNPAFRKARP